MGLLGCVAWMLSDAGTLLAFCGSGAGLAWSVCLALRELRRASTRLVLMPDGGATVDGHPVDGLHASWRGPLTSLRWVRGGRGTFLLGFPDSLEPAARRELRLWALTRREPADPAAVAP